MRPSTKSASRWMVGVVGDLGVKSAVVDPVTESAIGSVYGWEGGGVSQWVSGIGSSAASTKNIVAIKNMNVAEAEANSRSVCSGNLGGSGGQVVVIGDG